MKRINGQIKDQEELAKQVLSWITCAKRPLATVELQHALAVEIGESYLDKDNLPDIEDIFSVCAGLVTVDDKSKIIRLVHYTTQEYFDRTWERWFPNAKTDIVTICVTYLSFNEFESGICENDKEFEERLRSNKLYDYAAQNWGYHAREASTSRQIGVIEFLQKQAQVEASSQALLAKRFWTRGIYNHKVPKQMTGLHLSAYFGVDDAVQFLLDGNNPNPKDSYNRTPLSWAAENGHKTVAKLLLEHKADVESKDIYGRTPLSWAAGNGHEAVVQLLLEYKADVELKDTENGQTPLSWAAKNGHKIVVQLLL